MLLSIRNLGRAQQGWFMCCHRQGPGSQITSHSCFFSFYFSLSKHFLEFVHNLIWNQCSKDYRNGICSNPASEDWSICTRGNKSLVLEWAGCISQSRNSCPNVVRAGICMNCVQGTLWNLSVLVRHLHTCVCMHVCPGPREALLECFSPSLMFSSCEGSSVDEVPGIPVALYLFCTAEMGWLAW